LIKFKDCIDFAKQTEIMIQLFKYIYYLDYKKKSLRICYYDNRKKCNDINNNGLFEIKEKIYSISLSTIENKIFVCLSEIKNVKILDYDLENKTLKLNEKEIIDNTLTGINHFYKCIQITNNKFVTSDNKYIKIWSNDNEKFTEVKIIEINVTSFDIILANNEYLITSQPDNKEISLYDINNFEKIKKISKIDSVNSTTVFVKIKDDYIIINCLKGIALFYNH
jgi:WD40 repeat protein